MEESKRLYTIQRPFAAFSAGAAVAALGGLIGLGGAEFRLPLLITIFELYPHRAIRINLLISLATLSVSGMSRLAFAGATHVSDYEPVIVAMIAGGMASAWTGAGLLSRIPRDRVSGIIAALLLIVAVLLAFEAIFPLTQFRALSQDSVADIPIALGAGLIVGAISSLLGVAGGEFLIPIMIFVFGADIKTAGTASVLISTPLVLTGVVRHIIEGKFRSKTMLAHLAIPMSAGSIAGAIIGGYGADWAPTVLLKGILAAILVVSSVKLLKPH